MLAEVDWDEVAVHVNGKLFLFLAHAQVMHDDECPPSYLIPSFHLSIPLSSYRLMAGH